MVFVPDADDLGSAVDRHVRRIDLRNEKNREEFEEMFDPRDPLVQ